VPPYVRIGALRAGSVAGRGHAELGHTNPSLALAVYAQAMRMSEEESARLRAIVEGSLDRLGSRRGQDNVGESPQTATIESKAPSEQKPGISRVNAVQP
jgi:hypothetical protein